MSERSLRIGRWFRSRWWPGLLLISGGLAAAVAISPGQNEEMSGGRLLVFLATTVIGALGMVSIVQWIEHRRFTRGDRHERIRRLTRNLRAAVTAVDALRAEVEQGQEALEVLERRVEVSRELAKLSDPQADAVRALLSDQLETEGRRTFRRDVILGTVFFLLGVGTSRIFGGG